MPAQPNTGGSQPGHCPRWLTPGESELDAPLGEGLAGLAEARGVDSDITPVFRIVDGDPYSCAQG